MDDNLDVTLKFLTLNVRGIRTHKKRKSLLYWLKKRKNPDVIFLQETYIDEKLSRILSKEWTGDVYHSYTDSAHSRGVSILIKPGLDILVTSKYTCNEGRKLLLNVKYKDTSFTFVNLYAPNNCTNRIEFLTEAQQWISENAHTESNLIVCGDLNSVLDSRERSSGTIQLCSPALESFIKLNKLVDTWRLMNKNTLEYTYIDPSKKGSGSRIDYILMSDKLSNAVTSSHITTAPVPDHKAVITCLTCNSKPRGRGYWKLNNKLLDDTSYIENIKDIFAGTLKEYEDIACKRDIWDLCKIRFKEYSIKYAIQKCKLLKDQMKSLEKSINDLDRLLIHDSQNDELRQARQTQKSEYDNLCATKAKGAQIRARARWVEDGERSTSFFLKLESYRQTNSTINKLKTVDGTIVEKDKDILKEATTFYKDLYSTKNISTEHIKTYLDKVKIEHKLDETAQASCEGLVTNKEGQLIIARLPKNKAPGLDGLTYEFYQKLWPDLGPFIIDVYNESFKQGTLAFSQKQSVLSLIYKKGDRANISNYRPLSLTNSDYKILAFILADRLQNVIPQVISSDQTAYIKRRNIGQNLRLIQDIIEHADQHHKTGVLLFLDFKKAFDSVEHNFIYETLDAFNLGPEFIRWMKTLYSQTQTCIKNNGYLSSTFDITRGIKQGCPISALLFNLVVEILAIKIKTNNSIKGYSLNVGEHKREVKLSQYADDSTVILQDEAQIPLTLREIKEFSKLAGPTLNIQKTIGLMLGKDKHRTGLIHGITFTDKPIKCLGIYLGYSEAECVRLNWREKINSIERLLANWKKRDLTIFGKTAIIKALAISKIIHVAQNTVVPDYAVKDINTLLFRFIWGQTDRIKRKILYNSVSDGGVGMINMEVFFKALKATWINRIISNKNENWAFFGNHLLSKYVGQPELIEKMSFDRTTCYPAFDKLSPFYQEAILAYNSAKTNKILLYQDEREILLDQVLWGNQNFTTEYSNRSRKRTLYLKTWINCGITCVKDLRFVNGEVDERYVYNKLHNRSNYLAEMHIIKTALRPFSQILHCNEPEMHANIQPSAPSLLKSKQYYIAIMGEICDRPKSENKWLTLLHGTTMSDINLNFNDIYIRKVKSIKEKKLAEFNYKILHMILCCNANLNKWGIIDTDKCEVCEMKEDIVHLLFSCQHAQHIWTFVRRFLDIDFNEIDIVCGRAGDFTVNYLGTIIAYVIYKEWLICKDLHVRRTAFNRKMYFQHELTFRSTILNILGESNISDLLECLSQNVEYL